jgi:hypothetical protein
LAKEKKDWKLFSFQHGILSESNAQVESKAVFNAFFPFAPKSFHRCKK